jgi:hypothetical protein
MNIPRRLVLFAIVMHRIGLRPNEFKVSPHLRRKMTRTYAAKITGTTDSVGIPPAPLDKLIL